MFDVYFVPKVVLFSLYTYEIKRLIILLVVLFRTKSRFIVQRSVPKVVLFRTKSRFIREVPYIILECFTTI